MRIDVIFDTICPWCFVGKRRLERALRERPHVIAELTWRPFLLNPDLPPEGIPRSTYLERKFGGPARVARMLAGLQEAGRHEGLSFNFDAIDRTPNSMNSHRLVHLAATQGAAGGIVDALFRAYFQDGRDIGRIEVLADIAAAEGLPRKEVLAYLQSESGRGEVFVENAQTHRLSINGVPCFIFDGTYGIAGAQDPQILVRMIDMALEGSLQEPISQARSARQPL